jgi:hypothetical protein
VIRNVPRHWIDIRREWAVLSVYQRFEVLVALVLTFVIGHELDPASALALAILSRLFARHTG